MTCSVSKTDYVLSIFIRLGEGGRGKKVTAILRRSSSRGLDTPKVKIASVPVPAFTGNKMASSNSQIREEEQPSDRPEPTQIARDRSLKQTKSKYKTGGISDVRTVPSDNHINQFPGQHLSFRGNTIFCTACKEVVSSKGKHFVIPLCFQKTHQWERKDQEVEVERTNHYRST